MIKLHLGCGSKKLNDYINIDILETDAVDEIHNITDLSKFENNSIDEIYASHVLEHFSRNEVKNVLQEWTRVLKKGGIIRLAVPNFEAIVKVYLENKNLKELMGLLYGGQDNKYNFHYVTFDFISIKEILTELQFKNINQYNWKDFLPNDFDDFSRAYLPHMDFDNGQLMSLNIIAEKI
ncbi:methyltransferase domain-containing protein [Halobacteriovorax sp. DA5]|uniref:class I SAM-dependent methyltransferase n=1 Tax=Halobacteriovorax sp. DA5 TaxID=2067553 RepID=UPI0018EC2B6F|nr:methyltransferase domain-containing protein [Halobacteriovorax sp. DA5]